jgi:hypothetical protein
MTDTMIQGHSPSQYNVHQISTYMHSFKHGSDSPASQGPTQISIYKLSLQITHLDFQLYLLPSTEMS